MIDEFNPSNINDSSNKLNEFKLESNKNNQNDENEDNICKKFYQEYSEFCDDKNINGGINENSSTKGISCNYCKNGKAVYYDHNIYACEDCVKKIINHEGETNHKFNLMDEKKGELEKEKNKFLKKFLNVIKKFIFKCDCIIKYESPYYVDPDTCQCFQYPSIGKEDDPEAQIAFLNEINKFHNKIKEKAYNIKEKELSMSLLTYFTELFDGQIQLNKKTDKIDDENDDFYSDEKCETSESGDESNENITITNTKDKFYYIVNIIHKEKYMFENINYNKTILEKLAKALETEKNNISILTNNNSIFINNFIKSQTFAKLSPKNIRINYPNLHKLYDIKIIIDGIIRLKSEIPVEFLDYKYNFIIPNLSLNNKRGSEKYNPPYGWIGIGLNVNKIYNNNDNSWLQKDNDSWAIAYYGFGKFLNSEEIGKFLRDIIVKRKFKKKLTKKSGELDIRHNKGFFLSPFPDIAEKNSGTFIFNKKIYKIVLMAKVLISKIKKSEDHGFWVLNENDIRVYKILVKEKQ